MAAILLRGTQLALGLVLAACSSSDAQDEPHRSTCGDGLAELSEECDDGNAVSGDGCSSQCTRETGWICGWGEHSGPGSCETTCGDGTVAGNEACDHPPTPGMSHCKPDCSGEDGSCGDGVLQAHAFAKEECDTGAQSDPGCQACAVTFSFSCSGTPSTCSQSGLDSKKLLTSLSEAEKLSFCKWLVQTLGGAGVELLCEGSHFIVSPPEECVWKWFAGKLGTCTIGNIETYLGEMKSPCDYIVSGDTPDYCN